MIRIIQPGDVIRKWFDNLEHPVFLDITSQASYEAGHPAFALSLPSERLSDKAAVQRCLENPGREVIIFGENESLDDAMRVARLLQQDGFMNLYILQGGKKRWKDESLPYDGFHYPPQAPQGPLSQPQRQKTEPDQRPPLNRKAAA